MGVNESKVKNVIFPAEVFQQMRCSSCKKYLSCPPIQLLSDGRNVCGRCPLPPSNIVVAYRETALELALSHTKFPCSYKDYGCSLQLLFGHCLDHEMKCVYQPFACPSTPLTNCSWKGSLVQVYDHFISDHSSLVHSKGKFQLDICVNAENILMITADYVTFLLGYKYEAATCTLKYDVRHFSPYALNPDFKIQLKSSSNPGNSINLKGDKCLPYSFDPPTFPECYALSLDQFLTVLANPTILEMEIIFPTFNSIVKQAAKSYEFVNYEFLDTIRCVSCENYLSLPIFDSPQGAVCSSCNKSYPPSKNDDLHKRVAGANYPCRWNDCKVVCKGHSIRVHEFICPYQPQTCPARRCGTPLIPANTTHMQFHLAFYHNYFFFHKNVEYSTKSFVKSKKFATVIKDNEVVIIKHKKIPNDVHTFKLVSLKSAASNVNANLHFEHSHCKLKSRKFVVGNNMEIKIEQQLLPECFRSKKKMIALIVMQ